MNSRLTLGLAGLLLTGAIVAGYKGMQLSNQLDQEAAANTMPAPPPAPVTEAPVSQPPVSAVERVTNWQDEEQRTPVLVLAKPLAPFEKITSDHLATEQLKIAPPGSFKTEDSVLDRHVWQHLPAGTVLNASVFKAGGPLAQLIGKNERALAIAIDEVSGGGGFIQPGDYVDVLLYLRKNETNSDQTAQVVVPALRVLSFGEEVSVGPNGQSVQFSEEENEKSASSRRRPAQNAVLAVPAPLTTRFMLAAQVGTLQLAVRSADEQRLADYFQHGLKESELKEIERQLFQFEKLAIKQAKKAAQPGLVKRVASIPVYHGPDVSRQTP